MAAAQLKLNRFEKAIMSCTKVLELDPKNAKALFRRGSAQHALQNVDRARADLEQYAVPVFGPLSVV